MADTIAAISTGNAPGGIGVIRISGDAAIETAAKVFAPADESQLTELKGYRAKYGNIIIDGERADNAVALVFRAPRSYTGENVVELSVHGGLLMVQKTLAAVLSAGARPAQAGEFTKRAFLNGKMDLSQAEAVGERISKRQNGLDSGGKRCDLNIITRRSKLKSIVQRIAGQFEHKNQLCFAKTARLLGCYGGVG